MGLRHTALRRRSRRARQSGSPTGLLGGPEALIYQCLNLTPTGERGGPSTPRRNESTASAAPLPADPLGVGVPHPHPLRCLFPKRNRYRRRSRPSSLYRSPTVPRGSPVARGPIRFPRWSRDAIAPTPDSTPACAAPNPCSHRSSGNVRSPLSRFGAGIHQNTRVRWAPASPCRSGEARPRPTKRPNLGGRPRGPRRARSHVEAGAPSVEQDPSSPNLNVGVHRADPVRQIPSVEINLVTPQGLQFERGKPGEHRHCCRRNGADAPHYPDGHRPVQPPDLRETAAVGHQILRPSELRRGASIAPRRRTAGALWRRARPAEEANILMRSLSPRQTVPGAQSERRNSSGCRWSGPDTSC